MEGGERDGGRRCRNREEEGCKEETEGCREERKSVYVVWHICVTYTPTQLVQCVCMSGGCGCVWVQSEVCMCVCQDAMCVCVCTAVLGSVEVCMSSAGWVNLSHIHILHSVSGRLCVCMGNMREGDGCRGNHGCLGNRIPKGISRCCYGVVMATSG